jgi:hypothetical protein
MATRDVEEEMPCPLAPRPLGHVIFVSQVCETADFRRRRCHHRRLNHHQGQFWGEGVALRAAGWSLSRSYIDHLVWLRIILCEIDPVEGAQLQTTEELGLGQRLGRRAHPSSQQDHRHMHMHCTQHTAASRQLAAKTGTRTRGGARTSGS